MDYEAIIGLEIHMQLNAPTKMFCDCPNTSDAPPNRNTCPVCLWMPGAIPGFSDRVLEKAVMLCLALNCKIQKESAFDQKVYYYPDLPKGFQLSQFHKPLSRDGWLDIIDENKKNKRLRIRNIHMEEDVAKLVHEAEGKKQISLVDFNRAGAPLVEIVTEPDMRNPHDAVEFLKTLKTQIRYVDSSECSMEKGTMRVDANISIRPRGTREFNTKVEVKNMNSIRSVSDAIEFEIKRQGKQVAAGETVILHTRLWDPEKEITIPMRSKFEGPCIPDPCVARIKVSDEWLKEMYSRLPEMPGRKKERYIEQYGLDVQESTLMSSELGIAEYFEDAVNKGIQPRTAAQWISSQLIPGLKERNLSIESMPVSAGRFVSLLKMLEKDQINVNSAKKVLAKLFDTDKSPEEIVQQEGFMQVSDLTEIEKLADKVIADNPGAVEDYRKGEEKSMGFLIGQVMYKSHGKANPRLIRAALLKKLK